MEENQEQYPYVPEAVILWLEKQFPNQIPMKEQSIFDYGRAVGQQDIIQHLKQVKQWSEEKDV